MKKLSNKNTKRKLQLLKLINQEIQNTTIVYLTDHSLSNITHNTIILIASKNSSSLKLEKCKYK